MLKSSKPTINRTETDWLRALGVLALATHATYIYWLIVHINGSYIVWAWVFVIANVFGWLMLLLFAVNNITRKTIKPYVSLLKRWPKVAVLIPVWSEPVEIVEQTIISVISQDYPSSKMMIIVTDDGHSHQLKSMVTRLSKKNKAVDIRYNRPNKKGTQIRNKLGEGKAGNLNSALQLIKNDSTIKFVETRDCDDLVADKKFLKYCVSYLMTSKQIAYVQTIKDVYTDTKDTFDNHQAAFYRHELRSKFAANAVFPCGSGVLYRKQAVLDIGGFAAWNLVEDFQTGMEILRRGWKAGYLPIVGAMGQIAPHDMPNFYKQRGTWTLDSVRLMLFLKKSGLNIRQRLHFMEAATYYMLSWIALPFVLSTAASLITNSYPFNFEVSDYLLLFIPSLVLTQLYVYIARGAPGLRSFLRTYQVFWFSMMFVYTWMTIKALVYGKNKKPRYVVTRKTHRFGMYWRQVIPQAIITAILVGSVFHEVYFAESLVQINYFAVGWSLFFAYMFGYSLKMAVYGVNFTRSNSLRPKNSRSAVSGIVLG